MVGSKLPATDYLKQAMHALSGHDTRLVRAIGRWSLAALMFNTIIGASVFGVPSLLAARLGALSVPGYLIAAVGVGIIAGTLAEVASNSARPAGLIFTLAPRLGRSSPSRSAG